MMGRLFVLALILALGLSRPVAADSVQLSPASMRATGQAALQAKRPEVALQIADALLARDPNDWQALLIQSQAARDLGQLDLARAAAQRAWRLAETRPQRYAAALARAQAEASDGRRTVSQLWLRRAAQDAPDEHARALALRDFRYVRARNPLRVNFGFGIVPSSNINGGSSSDTLWLTLFGQPIPFTLSPEAQALSGIETRLSLGVERRISTGPRHETRLGVNLSGRVYSLSSEARRKAPDADADDYAFAAAELYLGHEGQPSGWRAPWDMRATLGHNIYGGDPFSNYARLDLGKAIALPDRQRLRVGMGLERQWRQDRPDRSATIQSLETRYARPVPGGALSFDLRAARVRSQASDVDHTAYGVDADYTLAKPLAGARIGLNLGLETRDYDRSAFDPAGREDLKLRLGVTAFLPDLDYMGFAPEVSLQAARTNSNISLYDSRDIGVGFNLRSAF